jgi:hypothetical protein
VSGCLTTAQLLRDLQRPHRPEEGAGLFWVVRDTRWDPYPDPGPQHLAAHTWEGWWLPLPDGRWFKSSVSMRVNATACGPALLGSWVTDEDRCVRFERGEVTP